MVIRRRVLASGEVQGVFFRDTCRRMATEAGVRGWARHLSDGRIEAVFEGEEAEVERLVEWCRHGPDQARVSGLEVHEEEPVGEQGFQVD